MLEIPLFDMHWGIAFMDHYKQTLESILKVITTHNWKTIVIPFGQDFFHNDSIVNGQTTKGTVIEKVDMRRAVKEGQQFMYTWIESAIANADEVKVLYSPGNHDRSISWMFMQVLLARYGSDIVDDTMEFRRVFTYGKNTVMVTHGDSKNATAKNLAHIFPVTFPREFADATTREVHSGHLHHESDSDIFGVMVRRLSSGNATDEWSNKEDFIGAHKRFMLFDWSLEKLSAIYYI
jgi:UDP-2,3-diacylglucosamine pyrophosphatase LpxH